MSVWYCANPDALRVGSCTPETGGKPGTLHAHCRWTGSEEEEE